jgi:hypothetical protein
MKPTAVALSVLLLSGCTTLTAEKVANTSIDLAVLACAWPGPPCVAALGAMAVTTAVNLCITKGR